MKENVGRIDRAVRALVGPGLLAAGARRLARAPTRTSGAWMMVAGAMITESSITRVCPLNALLGLDTRTRRERDRDLQALLARSGRDDEAADRAAAMYDARHAVDSSAELIDPDVTLGPPAPPR